ncbi:MAG: hypothetical protein KDA68_03225 [Planctomycetaceae bacterium]|nr:hypothetical protein [Planctomycetaceae bacterium]
MDRALVWLSKRQKADGSFHSLDHLAKPRPPMRDEPGVTGLCIMAFLSRGHLPGEGPFGETMKRGVDFILGSQMEDGLLARQRHLYHGAYSHGIGALVLSELYGISKPENDLQHRRVIERAIDFSSKRYSQPKAMPDDEGGWRYFRRHGMSDSDLSVTSWNVMFLRSAKNAGFEINVRLIDEAVLYMQRLYDRNLRTFRYEIHSETPELNCSRGMAGAGVLSMAMAGMHQTEMAQEAARFILKYPFDQYTKPAGYEEYPCYSAFYCSHAMFQMGGKFWCEFFPVLADSMLSAQMDDGSWIMREGADIEYGAAYMTALSVLALTPPYQTLPIFQR